MLLHHQFNPGSTIHPKFYTNHFCPRVIQLGRLFNTPKPTKLNPITLSGPHNRHSPVIFSLRNHHNEDNYMELNEFQKPKPLEEETKEKSFWGAVSLIIGTAIGPGMLGLPAVTIKSGPLPSTIAILLSWVYVISSIILVAELSFAAMEDDNVAEVSFTGLATKALGGRAGTLVALVYASLSFSLLVACISGIGSIISQCFPSINPLIANSLFPFSVGVVLCFYPFKVIDNANRFLCFIMLFSISTLVLIGIVTARSDLLNSFALASWGLSSVLPAIPITVLTLGFHVITPFICKIAGNTVHEARKAILFGGFVPLLMVLSWNLIVLGLAGTKSASSSVKDPISLLLSVNSSALPAIQLFAFSALATSLIGYAVSFPKQVFDTSELIFGKSEMKQQNCYQAGKVGFVTYSCGRDLGIVGKISYSGWNSCVPALEVKSVYGFERIVMPLVLGVSVLIATFSRSAFSRALDFAGIYANCFLFGILPPLMTYIYQSRKKLRRYILPGGDGALVILFGIAVLLAIWH